MEQSFMKLCYIEEYTPFEIDYNVNESIDKLKREYENAYIKLTQSFWTKADEQTTVEEKKHIYDSLSLSCKEQLAYNYSRLSESEKVGL